MASLAPAALTKPRWLVALAFATLQAGCELDEVAVPEGGDVLVVEARLEAGTSVPNVMLHRSLRDGAPGLEPGAEVTMVGTRGDTIRLVDKDPAGCGMQAPASCYSAAGPVAIEPGDTYELQVRTRGGERVRGRTTLPGPFRGIRPVMEPGPQPTVCALPPGSTIELTWSPSEGAWAYLAMLQIWGMGAALEGTGIEVPEPLILTGLAISAADTTLIMPRDFGLFELAGDHTDLMLLLQDGFPPGVTARLTLSAIDRNYANAERGGGFSPAGQVRYSSVVGDGVGVFGSYLPLDLYVEVEEESDLPPC